MAHTYSVPLPQGTKGDLLLVSQIVWLQWQRCQMHWPWYTWVLEVQTRITAALRSQASLLQPVYEIKSWRVCNVSVGISSIYQWTESTWGTTWMWRAWRLGSVRTCCPRPSTMWPGHVDWTRRRNYSVENKRRKESPSGWNSSRNRFVDYCVILLAV